MRITHVSSKRDGSDGKCNSIPAADQGMVATWDSTRKRYKAWGKRSGRGDSLTAPALVPPSPPPSSGRNTTSAAIKEGARRRRATTIDPARSMASSSCALELRAAGPARELLRVREKQGGASSCHLVPWGRRTMGAKASLRAAQAAGHSATKGISSSSACLERSFPKEQRREPVTPEQVDQWMTESIGEIVRNVGEEPFLMRIFSSGGAPGVRLESEAALPESWPRIKKRWDRESRTPDAVILVEVLEQEEGESGAEADEATANCGVAGGARRTWGLVAQGRGMDSAACYILDTTRVKSSQGFCTHFCLARAKCFGEAVHVQLRNTWLQRTG